MGKYGRETHLLRGGYAKISTDDRGYIFLPRAVRPEVKKYNPRSEVDHFRIYTDKKVVLLYNFDFIPPPTFSRNTFVFPKLEVLFLHNNTCDQKCKLLCFFVRLVGYRSLIFIEVFCRD